MPDKNLTDTEIKKALECCSKDEINGLNIFTYGGVPMRSLLRYALNLINRLQAENGQLKREIENLESMQEISPEAKHFVDTKADKVISLLNEVIKSQNQIKSEAYKEFAERLKLRFSGTLSCSGEGIARAVDNLLKKLVGEDK